MPPRYWMLLALLVPCVLGCPPDDDDPAPAEEPCTLSQPTPYPSGSPYVGLHGNRENNNRVRCHAGDARTPGWHALEGYLIFQPISVSPDGGRLYATAARTEGCKLFAVDTATGELDWCAEELTVGAMAGTPEVDVEGHLYTTDGYLLDEPGGAAQVISWTADGQERWRTSLESLEPSLPRSAYRPPAGLHLTPGGYAATVTVDGIVVLLDRADGAIAASLDVPAATGYVPAAQEVPDVEIPEVVMDKLEAVVGPLDPDEVATVFGASAGDSGAYSDNTVGVAADDMLYLVGGGPDEDTGALIAVDLSGAPVLELRWTLTFPGGSATSPAISPDGDQLAIGDGAGNLLFVDLDSCHANFDDDPSPLGCAAAWSYALRGGGLLGSVALDEDGVVTAWHGAGEPDEPDLFALRDAGDHPELLWELAFPADDGTSDVQWTSVGTVFDDVVLGTITTMAAVLPTPDGPPVLVNGHHEVVAVDRRLGQVVWREPIADDSINSPAIGPDGALYIPLFGMLDLMSINPDIEYRGGIAQLTPPG